MSSLFSKTITVPKEHKVSDEEFANLRDFIYEQSGIYIADNRKYLLENRLVNRLKDLNLKTFGEYFYFLKYDPGRKRELNRLFEVITTNETSFYRNPPQLKVFQDIILQEVLNEQRKKGCKELRIWSAGCSTGEEPYTLAIMLHEVLKFEINSWNIRITANDLSEGVLHAARRGIYTEYALRTTPKEIVSRYFDDDGEGRFRVKNEVRNLVQFGQINLSDRLQVKRVERSQIVFCRNVIIYFDEDMKRQVIGSYYDNLLPGGYLFIGHSESLHNLSRAFKPVHHPGTIVYKKEA
ncbi:protein-glutamate O-methyltransferase CheR [Desulfovibrionales bacterium]